MHDFFGDNCVCTDPENRKEESGYCSDCGTKLEWISKGVGAEVLACPNCS